MEIQIISKDSIKPSSSTPSHLQTYQISLLDQFSSSIHFSFALFYSSTDHPLHQRSLVLKHSLSETLSRFYPLAGKIKDNQSIDCDDGGACYIEAISNISLPEFLTRPHLSLLHKFVPDVSSINRNPVGANVLLIQETAFTCGGLGIGFSVSHMAVDGVAFASFIKAWASSAFSSGEQIVYPCLDSPVRFPKHDGLLDPYLAAVFTPFMKIDRLAVRRLLFDASAVGELKRKATSSILEKQNPTRVEVVSAVVCTSLMAALNAKSGTEKPMAINHNVNMRAKAVPPLPNCSLGNFTWIVCAVCNSTEFSSIVSQLRNAIRQIDRDFVKKIETEEGGGYNRLCEMVKEKGNAMSNGVEFIIFSSWCNFGLYDCDFGWGKPVWMAHCSLIDQQETTFMDMAYLNDTPNANEVEVWLYVPQDVAALLDDDSELLQYVSINPSPLSHA